MRAVSFFAFSPTLVFSFSLAFVRLSPTKNQGINWLEKEAVPDTESLDRCFPIPYGYFDIAQFIPDNATPGYRTKYKPKEIYDPSPDKNYYWITVPDAMITQVEFYTGTECKNAVYQQDEEGLLRYSVIKEKKLPRVVPPTQQTQTVMEEEDKDYYRDFDMDMLETAIVEQQIEVQSNVGNLGTTGQERKEIEPPVDGETMEEEIGRQERNFLRFFEDTENDGGIALNGDYTTLVWSENWRSFKLSWVPTSGAT